jgi:hypothetical protein
MKGYFVGLIVGMLLGGLLIYLLQPQDRTAPNA